MYLTFERDKLENVTNLEEECNEPSTSNIEFVNVSLGNDEQSDDGSITKTEGTSSPVYFNIL